MLEVNNLKMYYYLQSGAVLKAVDGVTFSIKPRDRLGLVGESGCGKSSLAMTLLGLLPHNGEIVGGSIFFEGKDLLQFSSKQWRKFRWEKMSMVFQAAMNALDPVYRVERQLYDIYNLHKDCTSVEALNHIRNLFKLTGLPESRLKSYPHQLSGGMKQRVIIAMSLLCSPSLIIADEPTTGLDVIIQDQIMKEIISLIEKLKLSMILISHDVSVVTEVCNKIMVMYGGKTVELGEVERVFDNPSHPYTIGLLQAFPSIRGPKKDLVSLPGSPPNLSEDLFGCRFAPRCPRKEAICEREDPFPHELNQNHWSLCHFAEDPDLRRIKFSRLNE